ncbi:MAG: sulfatase-like hydrolase/transferase [Acidobacteriota bacterium]|nr:MAG: sulfatase-like hydrolase/transferase [Acidobacteriota bacterium]
MKNIPLLILAFALALAPGCAQRSRPNVLFITVDTLRADRLGCAGYPIETPTIDRLAEEGVYFPNLYALAPLTLPSHTSLFTSMRPFSHGVRMNGVHVLGESHTTLAEILQKEGYETGAVTGAYVVHSMFGLSQGFSTYANVENPPPSERDPFETRISDRLGEDVTHMAEAWLKERKSPWFLWVHYYDPHSPYTPPEPYAARYKHAYDGEIAYADSEMGKLLDVLKNRGELDSTLVVFASDHGEGLGEHDEPEHGLFLYEPTVRAPVIVRGKNVPQGMRIEHAASHLGVAPMVLDLLGIEAPREFQGQSLRLLWERSGAFSPEMIYLETYEPYYNHQWAPMEALMQGGWKYILAPRPELYHVVEDPKEERDLVEEERERAEGLRRALLEERKRYPKAEPEKAELTEEALEKLQSLGYLTGGRMTWEEPDALAMVDGLPDIKERIDVLRLAKQARDEMLRGHMERSLELLEQALPLDPTNVQVLKRLAVFYRDLRRPWEELDMRRRLADIDPLHAPEYYRRLAEWETENGNLEAARQAWEKMLDSYDVLEVRLGTLFAENYYNRALCYKKLGQDEKAEAEIRAGLARYPDAPLLYYALGAFSQNARRWDQAQEMYEAALARDPNHRRAKVHLSKVLTRKAASASNSETRMRNLKRAAALLEEVHETFGPTAETLTDLARLNFSMKREDKVEELLLKALTVNPNYAKARVALAELSFRRGDTKLGIELCRKVLAAEPGNIEARKVLEHYAGVRETL